MKAGKNYYREKHVYIPLRLSTDHVTCGRALTKYKYIVASTGSTFNTHSHRHHRPSPIMSHDDDDDDDDSSSRLETRHVSRYKRRRWRRLPPSKSPSATISMTQVSFLFFFIYSLLMTIFLDYVRLTFQRWHKPRKHRESQGHEARWMHLDPRY